MKILRLKHMTYLKMAALVVSIPLLSGCAVNIDEYSDMEPELDLSEFFNGHLEAYGIVQDYKGKVSRRFRADILGQWKDDKGVLDEQFFFADGEEQHRCWKLSKSDKEYVGTAGDVIGEAKGLVAGNALNWSYVLSIPVDDKHWEINLNDWMYLVDENNLINRATMHKFGVEVGQITLYIRKVSSQAHRPLTQGCRV
ncbi:DUF3833 domain-containing protein [Neptunomonas antarctica]|uniref:Lipoprotein n=1 Tax=Neptunomonas antarctica TaxID=619304 RepID=A0A1N7LPG5_9GAMM|nr:DUF3833 domain-containing protein [Neptunomonas antarctica]SIS75730.1 Protein of unknown function [Neptunomonas antarctica]